MLREQRDGQPTRARAPRAPDAVHVVFDREREGDVDDGFDGGDVEAAGRDVGGDEEGAGARFEGGEGRGAFVLGHVAVDGGGVHPAGAEEGFDAGGFFFVEAEDEDAVVRLGAGALVLAEEVQEARLFVPRVDDLDALGDVGVGAELAGGVVGADGDVHGGSREGGCEGSDGGGPGGGEHEGLAAGGGGCGDDFADLVFEAFVEHAVCFVEYHVVDIAEGGGAFLYEIVQSTGSGDDDVCGFQGQALRVFGDTAVDADGGEVGGGGEVLDLVVDLRGEFAGRGDDDRSSW